MADITLEVSSAQINSGIKKIGSINGTAQEINEKLNKADSALQSVPEEYPQKTDYATSSTGGVLKTGNGLDIITSGTNQGKSFAVVRTKEQIEDDDDHFFISKGTLKNILTEYAKKSETTQRQYTFVNETLLSDHSFTAINEFVEIDLSEYLVDDNKQYDCIFAVYGTRTGDGSSIRRHILSFSTNVLPGATGGFYVYRTGEPGDFGNTVTVPVGADKKVTLKCSTNLTISFTEKVTLVFLGYKEV